MVLITIGMLVVDPHAHAETPSSADVPRSDLSTQRNGLQRATAVHFQNLDIVSGILGLINWS